MIYNIVHIVFCTVLIIQIYFCIWSSYTYLSLLICFEVSYENKSGSQLALYVSRLIVLLNLML